MTDLVFPLLEHICRCSKNSGRGLTLPETTDKIALFRDHFGGLRAFLAHGPFKFDFLPFVQGLKTVTLNFREMNETIFTFFRLNKTVTLALIESEEGEDCFVC